MNKLLSIQNDVTRMANAISSAINIEVVIVDNNLRIISGTGRYADRVGLMEENGDITTDRIYASILQSGKHYICLDTSTDPLYETVEGELSEISYPIIEENKTIGIISLVAFNQVQHEAINTRTKDLLEFLENIASLIASKSIESQVNLRFEKMINSMPEGLMSADKNGTIISCNQYGTELIGISEKDIVGTSISELFPVLDVQTELEGDVITTKEINICPDGKTIRIFITCLPIPPIGVLYLFQDAVKATFLMQDIYIDTATSFNDIYGNSPQIENVKKFAHQIAGGSSTVLITGESGTGKELFARAIHNNSDRVNEPFISVNCGAIPESLLESELFGYEPGAFTGANPKGKIGKFELANGGTIFLDEIGDMPLHLQVKLLRVLQSRNIERVGGMESIPIDVRVISATNKDLEAMITKNEFREDLYFRLNVIPLHIPSLRERAGDIELLLNTALIRFRRIAGKDIMGFSKDALSQLVQYDWPGNVRELENTVEYAVSIETKPIISLNSLPERILKPQTSRIPFHEAALPQTGTLKERTSEAERSIIAGTLESTGSDADGKAKAAALLGISVSSLYRKIRELGLQ